MKVGLYVGKDMGAGQSFRVMAAYIKDYLLGCGHDPVVASKVGELSGSDIVLNFIVEGVHAVEEERRYVGYGPQACLFASNVEEHTKYKLTGYLSSMESVTFIAHSPYHYDNILSAIGVFHPVHLKKLRANLKLIPWGVGAEFYSTNENDKKLWMLPFNRWQESQKQATKCTDVCVSARDVLAWKGEKGIVLRFNTMSISWEKETFKKRSNLLEVHACPENRGDYIALCQKVGMFVSTSSYESFGIMFLELIVSGAVGIFLDRPWIRKLLPEYKLLVENLADLPKMTVFVYNNYDRYASYLKKKVIPYIRETYSIPKFCKEITSCLEEIHNG